MSDTPNRWQSSLPRQSEVAAVGDFNGDGREDILWRSNLHEIGNWLATPTGSFQDNSGAGISVVAADWHVIGTGDFNGDGRDDILWRNDDGRLINWLGTAGGGFTDTVANALTSAAPTTWHVAAIGDFNGDGRDELLWRTEDAEMRIWLSVSNGAFATGGAGLWPVPLEWHVQGPDVLLV